MIENEFDIFPDEFDIFPVPIIRSWGQFGTLLSLHFPLLAKKVHIKNTVLNLVSLTELTETIGYKSFSSFPYQQKISIKAAQDIWSYIVANRYMYFYWLL